MSTTVLTSHLQTVGHIFTEMPFNKMLGLKLDKLEANEVVMSITMQESLIGNYLQNILHGGVISSVLDVAGGLAAAAITTSKYPDKSLQELAGILGKTSTVDLHIHYLRPGKGTHFQVKAYPVHSGNKITFTRMEFHNNESMLIATGSGSYAVG